MRKVISSRIAVGDPVVGIFVSALMVLCGVATLQSDLRRGLIFVLIGLALAHKFFPFTQPKFVAYDDHSLLVRGFFKEITVPIENVRQLSAHQKYACYFWIEFKVDTEFGKKILVRIPWKDSISDFPAPRRFDEWDSIREFIGAISRRTSVVPGEAMSPAA